MKFYSTGGATRSVDFRTAVLQGLADDGGLFLPEEIPLLAPSFWASMGTQSLSDMGFHIARAFLADTIDETTLREIVDGAIDFDAPLVRLDDGLFILELFHGPTLAFKDFGARFMAQVMEYLVRDSVETITILVATSGDTGSAVAHAFLGMEGIRVVLLYPSGKVSAIQEAQFTTLGRNVTALEVDGTFDDCQRLVKAAFLDERLSGRLRPASANSINIARLIPQSFYYCHAFGQLPDDTPPLFSVPSGNLGNLTAGTLARFAGLPVAAFVAATNANDVVVEYLKTGVFEPRTSVRTVSNAMDVGNPSNLARLTNIYQGDVKRMASHIFGAGGFSDGETKAAIREVYDRYGYVIDPHGAVGYLGLEACRSRCPDSPGVVLATAHPAKFLETVSGCVDEEIPLPPNLSACLEKEKQSRPMSADYEDFRSLLLHLG